MKKWGYPCMVFLGEVHANLPEVNKFRSLKEAGVGPQQYIEKNNKRFLKTPVQMSFCSGHFLIYSLNRAVLGGKLVD